MGFLSKIKNAVSKVVGKDPVAKAVMKVDPVARQIGRDTGLVQKPAGQADPQAGLPEVARSSFTPPTRSAGWQGDRVAALRARFSRLPAAPAATAPAASPIATKPAMPVEPAKRASMAPVANPAEADVSAYSRYWEAPGNNTY